MNTVTYKLVCRDTETPYSWANLVERCSPPQAQDSGRVRFEVLVAADQVDAFEAALNDDDDVLEYSDLTAIASGAADAIARSVSHNEIVTLDFDADAVATLERLCTDWVDGNDRREFWGGGYHVEFTADTEGNWCSQCSAGTYDTEAEAQAAIDADPTAKPDAYGNTCRPEIVGSPSWRVHVRHAASE